MSNNKRSNYLMRIITYVMNWNKYNYNYRITWPNNNNLKCNNFKYRNNKSNNRKYQNKKLYKLQTAHNSKGGMTCLETYPNRNQVNLQRVIIFIMMCINKMNYNVNNNKLNNNNKYNSRFYKKNTNKLQTAHNSKGGMTCLETCH
jgi:hypothetical protein